MKKIPIIMQLLWLLLLISCENGDTQNQKIDNFISTYENEDFSSFKNVYIAIRQNIVFGTIYMVGKPDGNLPIYFVKYNNIINDVTEIDRISLSESKIKDYFTDDKIKGIAYKFINYDFGLLSVNNKGDVFVNSFQINSPPILLRLNKQTDKKEIREGFVFQHYKGSWYKNLVGSGF